MNKQFKLKKPLALYEEFAAREVNKQEDTMVPTKTHTGEKSNAVQSGAEVRASIVKDVDTILSNLETLSKQIQESFEQIKQDIVDGNEEVLEVFSSLNESTLITEKDVTLGELMAYSEDDYKYLKDAAKKLGVTVSVVSGEDSMYDDMGYDTLSFRGPKDAVLKVAAISGHDQDICPDDRPDCGGYSITEESVEINEEDTVSKLVWDYLFKVKAAEADMDKVNKVKQNAVAIDLAAKGLDGSDKQEKAKKDKLVAKAKSAKEKGAELEKAVRDKYEDRSRLVQKVIQQKDIEGRLAAIKQETGMEEDPKKSKELKDKMKELNQQLKKEDDAIAQIEKDAEPEADSAKDTIEKYKDEVKKLKAKGYKAQGLKDGEEGDEVTLNHPETGKQKFSKPKGAKGSFDEEKVQAAIDKAKDAKKAYTDVEGNNNPIEIAKLELAVLIAELEMAKGKGDDAEKIKEIEDKIKAATLTSKRTAQTTKTPDFNEEAVQGEIDSAQEAYDAIKADDTKSDPEKAAVQVPLIKAKIKMAAGKGEDDKVAELQDELMQAEATAAADPRMVPGGQNDSVDYDLDPSRAIVEASVGGMMSYTEDDYKYLKDEAKKLGVKVSVDKDPFGDGYDELSFSGDKAAIMKLAGISGHAPDITAGVYTLEEGNEFGAARAEAIAKGEKTFKVGDEEYPVEDVSKDDKENAKEFVEEAKETTPKKIKLYEGMSVADKFKALM